MIFKLKDKYNNGDVRIIKLFLLFPKQIGDEIRWLCFAKVKQRYYSGDFYDSPCWLDESWS